MDFLTLFMQDTSLERINLIKSQLIPCGIRDTRLLTAMKEIPRELFTLHFFDNIAYQDEGIFFPNNRFMLSPLAVAQMIDAAHIKANDKILDIGCTTGYSTTVLSFIAKAVISIESDKDMSEVAQENLINMGSMDAKVLLAELNQGFPDKAPYDVIIIEGRIEEIPEAILYQLSENGGKIITAKGVHLISVERNGNSFSETVLGNIIAPPLPEFRKNQVFKF